MLLILLTDHIIKAGTELVPELQPHMPNWFPFEKGILLI